MRRLLLLLSWYSLLHLTSASAADLPGIMHYGLDVRFLLKEQRVNVVATLAITNSTKKSFTEIPFLLYRLLTVKAAGNPAGTPFPFEQDIVQLHDEPSLQARRVIVTLPSPLQPNDTVTLSLAYDGFIFGYPEVMAYVQDRIDEDYSLLRPDAFAYPVLAEPTFASALAANDTKFSYDVTATVPKGYQVACGGEKVESKTDSDSSMFVFRSKKPTWRIDVAVARFAVLGDPGDKLAV